MVILASASPRRKELLEIICNDFAVEPSNADETVTENIEITKRPEYLAEKKALEVSKNGHQNDTVIGCDTGVFIDEEMLGKPESPGEAKCMLRMLSGRTHSVITGCCVIKNGKKLSFSQKTSVAFYNLTDEEIDEYISTGEPMDKSGAYGIQGRGAVFVEGISGDYFNVVGLPIARLSRVLGNFDHDA